MNVDERGFQEIVGFKEPKAPALAAMATAAGYGLATQIGASPLVGITGALALGAKVWRASSNEPVDKVGELDFSGIKVSLNLTEAVIIPMMGGLVLTMSDDPSSRRNGVGLIALGAIGTMFAYHALQKTEAGRDEP
jgi:hypothetical protein